MAWDPHWDTAIHGSHAPGVGTGEPRTSAASRRVEGAPPAATAQGYGPDLLGCVVEALEELAEFAADGAARDRGRLAPAGVQALLGVEESTPTRSACDQDGAPRCDAVGCILVEREVSARPVVVREVAGESAAQVPFAEDEDVIQTLAPDGADEPLREGILPGAVSRREDFTYVHALHALAKRVAVDGVAIAEKKGRGRIVRERVDDLLGRPGSSGILGDVEVEDAPAIMCEHDKGEQDPQPHSGNDEEINGDQVADVISQERAPGLRGRCAALREEPGDGALGHADAEFQELTMDSRGTPEGIGRGHLYEKSRDLGADPRAAPRGAPKATTPPSPTRTLRGRQPSDSELK